MKPLILILLLFLGNSCNQSNDELLETSQNEDASQNDGLPIDQQLLGPNEVMFKIKIVEAFTGDKEICGDSKAHVFDVEIMEIMESGSSLLQKLSTEQRLEVSFLFEPEALQKDKILEAKARESLCQDTSTSYFTILAHKILE